MPRFLLAGALALAGCGRIRPEVGARVDPALAALVPSGTVLMVDTRIEALLQTPIYKQYLAQQQVPQVEQFARETGIDPRKDLRELLFVSDGHDGVLLGRGKFGGDVGAELEKEGATRSVYKGLNLIGNDRDAVVFLDSSTMAAGGIAAVRSLIDQRGHSHGPPAPLSALMKDLPADAQFWAAYTGGPVKLPFDAKSNLANVNKLLASLQSGTVYVSLGIGIGAAAEGTCSSDQDAQQIHDALKAMVGLGRLSVRPGQEDLLPFYDSIQVTRNARRVKAQVAVPEELAGKLLAAWTGARR
jgi:hypothetical protein